MRIKTGQEEQTDQRRGKSTEQKRKKIRFYFFVKMIPLKDGGGV